MEREILITGVSKKCYAAGKDAEEMRCCYICQKTENDKVVYIDENQEVVFVGIRLMPFKVRIIDSDLKAVFLLCQNCYLLLGSFLNRKSSRGFSGTRLRSRMWFDEGFGD